jgi:hypothetical protein
MASNVLDSGRTLREHNFEFLEHFFIQSFAMSLYFEQQRDPNSFLNSKNSGWIQDGGLKSVFLA